MPIYIQHSPGDALPAADWNSNFNVIESAFLDHGNYVVSGLTVSAGTGLSVNVAAGTAVIGADIPFASPFVIGSLADNTVNHLYVLQNGTGTSNATGTAPANSAKLGTATTAAGVVSSVAMGRNSGRQQFVQLQDEVHGGPSAGTASAGHPRSVNLASWNATAAEGFEVSGVLPAGAIGGSFTAPVTFTLSDATTNVVSDEMTLDHTSSGTPAAGFGQRLKFTGKSSTTTGRAMVQIEASWATATDASRKARWAVFVSDNAGNREALRAESDGTDALLGIGGGTAAGTHLFIQPTADANRALVLKNHSATLTGAAIFEQRNSADQVVTSIPAGGGINVGSIGASGSTAFQFYDGAAGVGGSITTFLGVRSGAGFTYQINSASDTDVPLQIFANSGTQSANIFETYDKGGALSFAVQADASIDVSKSGGKVGFMGATPVARTAAYTVTNPNTRRSYDTTTVTLPQLAEVVGTIIADFKLFGLLG